MAGISRGGERAFFDKLGGRIETEKDTANFLLDVAVSFSETKKNGSFYNRRSVNMQEYMSRKATVFFISVVQLICAF